jgi:hypothetical protein
MLSSIATLAYDCRRPEYFTEQLYAALQLIDRGVLSAGTRGSMHGEIGQTQFLPKNILAYGTGNLDVAANALSSTANFLRRGLPARRSQFRGHPGLERGSSRSARHRADRPPDRRRRGHRGALMRASSKRPRAALRAGVADRIQRVGLVELSQSPSSSQTGIDSYRCALRG